MKSRLIASIVVGVAVVLGTSGCAMFSEQATEIPYSPSDGVNIEGSAPLEVRNVFVVANADHSLGSLILAAVNQTDHDLTLNIQVGDAQTPVAIDVPANSVTSLGTEGTPPVVLQNFDTPPGATVKMYFQSGDVNGITTQVPVLDGTLTYYAHLVPTPTPTPNDPLAVGTPSPAPTP